VGPEGHPIVVILVNERHRQPLVVRPLHDHGGQAAPGARTADGDASAVDAELVGVFVQPAQCGKAVVDRRREGVPRGESIASADHG